MEIRRSLQHLCFLGLPAERSQLGKVNEVGYRAHPRGFRAGWLVRVGVLLLAALVLGSCRSTLLGKPGIARTAIDEEYARRQAEFDVSHAKAKEEVEVREQVQAAAGPQAAQEAGPSGAAEGAAPAEETGPRLYTGTDQFVRAAPPPKKSRSVGEITLNFENTDIREVVKVILSDMLGMNYLLDPRVKGGVTMQTGTPLSRDALLPTLETMLRMNGAALVYTGGAYEVIPVSNAIRGRITPQIGDIAKPLPRGYGLRVVPLKYVSVTEMNKILAPLAPEGSIIRADSLRNILLLAGTSPELENLVETIHVFDVDWMKGLSVGFFPLQYMSLEDITYDLNAVFGDQAEGPLAGMLRLVPIESANGLLVVTPQKKYLKEVKTWIERFDRLGGGLGGASEHLYVYRVRNGEASDLADLLNELFSEQQQGKARPPAELAPGAEPASIKSSTTPDETAAPSRPSLRVAGGDSSSMLTSKVHFVADDKNNSLLIMSTPGDYEKILDALKQLDVTPLQVLVEATILEVGLNDELKYGIRWSLTTGTPGSSTKNQNFNLDGTQDIAGGFSWELVTSSGNVKAVFKAFAGEGLVRVLSSPSVMVLDNRTARIQVGDEVPIATSQQSGTDINSTLVNNIEYRDTGVVLEVTPRVNPGGLVTMDISQEVSRAEQTTASSLDSPTISTRKITSTVAVQNSQTVVLGGLIRDETTDTHGGVPGMYKMPFVGSLFGESNQQALRTELVIILTPKVISGEKDILSVTEDFRARLKGLEGKF